MSSKKVLLWFLKCWMNLFRSIYSSPSPSHESSPTLTLVPLPILHAIQWLIKGNAWTNAFHPVDPFLWVLFGFLNHSTKEVFVYYFLIITLPHNESGFWDNLYNAFDARDLHNKVRFFIPHPPLSFGREITDHLTSGIPFACFLDVHRKEKHLFLIFVKIPFGI